ncbi:MAG: hypothetical protein Q9188_003977 [Gyalolechia gomerana]
MAKIAGQKRQAIQAGVDSGEPSRRTRSKHSSEESVTSRTNKRATRSSDQSISTSDEILKVNSYVSPPAKKASTTELSAQTTPNGKKKIVKKGIAQKVVNSKKTSSPKVTESKPRPSLEAKYKSKSEAKAAERPGPSLSEVAIPTREKDDKATEDEAPEDDDSDGPSYWLMKAEPESRFEKGKDVKFSIDDLKNATEPEAWDGVRNATARNNIRAMMQGDMAFFYHSNCKKPGIVGTMEIVQEHSVDETAFDPEHPYYDEKSIREKPKWFVVHVEFRRKFPALVSLKELQKFAKPGGVLENM